MEIGDKVPTSLDLHYSSYCRWCLSIGITPALQSQWAKQSTFITAKSDSLLTTAKSRQDNPYALLSEL